MTVNNCRIYDLYPGYDCNAACLFCFNPDTSPQQRPKGFSFPAVARELYAMRSLGHRHVNILGGEPTVRKDLPLICAAAKKMGYLTVAITTNGIRTADAGLVGALADGGLDVAMVSVHGHTPELHDGIVGVPGALAKVLRSIENFQAAGISVQVAIVAHRLNHACLPDFFRFFLDRGVMRFTVLYLRYHGHMDVPDGRSEMLRVRMTEAARSVHEAFKIFLERGLTTPRLCHILPCVLPGYETRMDNLTNPESRLTDGHYLDPDTRSRSSEWVDHKDKVKLPQCHRCVVSDICPGVEGVYLKIYGDGEIQPLLRKPLPFSGERS